MYVFRPTRRYRLTLAHSFCDTHLQFIESKASTGEFNSIQHIRRALRPPPGIFLECGTHNTCGKGTRDSVRY